MRRVRRLLHLSPVGRGIGGLRPPFLAPRTPMRSIGYGALARRVRGNRAIENHLPPHPTPLPTQVGPARLAHEKCETRASPVSREREHAEFAALSNPNRTACVALGVCQARRARTLTPCPAGLH